MLYLYTRTLTIISYTLTLSLVNFEEKINNNEGKTHYNILYQRGPINTLKYVGKG